jgi:hypothetical protein
VAGCGSASGGRSRQQQTSHETNLSMKSNRSADRDHI